MMETIAKQAAIDALCSVCGVDCDKSKFVYGGKQEDQVILCPEHYVLTQLPSVQPEIILCKDCTWCQNDTVHSKVFCSREGAMDWIEPNSYCSYGERETDGSD